MPIVEGLSPIFAKDKLSPMNDSEDFELKLDRLIALCHKLKRENQALRKREENLIGERSSLMKKNEMAKQKVETMISRLQALSAEQ
jgi:cell division protein ZapB